MTLPATSSLSRCKCCKGSSLLCGFWFWGFCRCFFFVVLRLAEAWDGLCFAAFPSGNLKCISSHCASLSYPLLSGYLPALLEHEEESSFLATSGDGWRPYKTTAAQSSCAVSPEENGPGVCPGDALTTHCAEKSPGWLPWAPRQLPCECCPVQAGCGGIREVCSFSAWHRWNSRLHFCPFVRALKTLLVSSPA